MARKRMIVIACYANRSSELAGATPSILQVQKLQRRCPSTGNFSSAECAEIIGLIAPEPTQSARCARGQQQGASGLAVRL